MDDIAKKTLPPDFERNPRIHSCFRIMRRGASRPVPSAGQSDDTTQGATCRLSHQTPRSCDCSTLSPTISPWTATRRIGSWPMKGRAGRLRDYPVSIADLAARGGLRELPGIGEAIERKVLEYMETGEVAKLNELRAKYPEGLLEVMHLPGVGPKTARNLWEALGIIDLEQLKLACERHLIRELPGMGEKTEANLLRAIATYEARSGPQPRRDGGASGRKPGGGVTRGAPGRGRRLWRQPAPPSLHGARHRPGGRLSRSRRDHGCILRTARAGVDRRARRDQADGRHPHRAERRPARGSAAVLRQPAAAFHRQRRAQRGPASLRPAPRLQDLRVQRGARGQRPPDHLRHRGRGLRTRGPALHPARATGEPGGDRSFRKRAAPAPDRAPGSAGRPPRPHRLDRRPRHHRADGFRRLGEGSRVHVLRGPLAVLGHGRWTWGRSGWPNRWKPSASWTPGLPGISSAVRHRGGHSSRRPARPSRRDRWRNWTSSPPASTPVSISLGRRS